MRQEHFDLFRISCSKVGLACSWPLPAVAFGKTDPAFDQTPTMSMNPRISNAELEARVRHLIKLVDAQKKIEDTRFELKSTWPADNSKSARQIAALSNAAQSPWVVWVVGVDEERGLVGASPDEMADWWPKIKRCFDEGMAPDLTANLAIPVGDKIVYALQFDTTRAPYVVKNGDFLEVPWRSGTRTRSAKRHELLTLLVERASSPEIEFLDGHVHQWATGLSELKINLYFIHRKTNSLVVPSHRCGWSIHQAGVQLMGPEPRFKIQHFHDLIPDEEFTLGGGLTLYGCGAVKLVARFESVVTPIPNRHESLDIEVSLAPVDIDEPMIIRLCGIPAPGSVPTWQLMLPTN